jgi:hypothetical protein
MDAEAIRREGFRLNPPQTDNVVFLTDDPDLAARYGEIVLEIEADLAHPLELTYGDRSPYGGREALAAAGYDAICVSYPQGARLFPNGPGAIVTVADPSLLTIVGERAAHYDAPSDHWYADPV